MFSEIYEWVSNQLKNNPWKWALGFVAVVAVATVGYFYYPLILSYFSYYWPLVVETLSELLATGYNFVAGFFASELGQALLSLALTLVMIVIEIKILQYFLAPRTTSSFQNARREAEAESTSGILNTLSQFFGLAPAPTAVRTQDPKTPKEILETLKDKIVGYKPALRQLMTVFMNRKAKGANMGAVLYGPPGTGKTTIATEIAELFEHCCVMRGSELHTSLWGESEKKVKALFDEAKNSEDNSIYVLVLDELDALFPKRGVNKNSTFVDSLTGTMLANMSKTMLPRNNLVILGITNRIDMLDPALIRPGRLGLHVFFDYPTVGDRLTILRHKAAELKIEEGVVWNRWGDKTVGFTGADLEGLLNSSKNKMQLDEGDFDVPIGADEAELRPCTLTEEVLDETFQEMLVEKAKEIRKANIHQMFTRESKDEDESNLDQGIRIVVVPMHEKN